MQRSRQENGWQLGTVRGKQIQTDAQEESAGLLGRWKQRRKERKEEKQRELGGLCRCPGIPSHLMALLRKNGELRKDMAEQNTKRSVEQKIAE